MWANNSGTIVHVLMDGRLWELGFSLLESEVVGNYGQGEGYNES